MPRPAHFEIHADNPTRAQTFYESVFGWTFTAWGDAYWLITTGNNEPGIDGGMTPRHGERPAVGSGVNAYVVTVNVPDIDTSIAAATAAGATMVVDKAAVPGVGWLAYVTDTEGNILGLMQSDETAA
jgi:predicted enzyme related to lactoylglutathione lyase